MKKILLWLDDLRNPFLNLENKLPKCDFDEIVWVRSYNEFMYWLLRNGKPYAVSFDHDLHDEHYTPEEYWNDYEASKKYQEAKLSEYKHETGVQCAKILRVYCENIDAPLPKTYVHSANPVGCDWIKKELNKF